GRARARVPHPPPAPRAPPGGGGGGGGAARPPPPPPRRAVRLALTPVGSGRLAEVRDGRAELTRRLTADWPPEEQQAFCALLARFNHAMESYTADQQGQ
ncbi:hypothetical protein ACFV6I_39095, partial [Kitasatospora sp. NPDC059803]